MRKIFPAAARDGGQAKRKEHSAKSKDHVIDFFFMSFLSVLILALDTRPFSLD